MQVCETIITATAMEPPPSYGSEKSHSLSLLSRIPHPLCCCTIELIYYNVCMFTFEIDIEQISHEILSTFLIANLCMVIGHGMASVDLGEKPCRDVELRKVVAYHKLNKSRVMCG